MDDLRVGNSYRTLFLEQRHDGELTVRLRSLNKNIGTVLSREQEDQVREWLIERHANRA